MSMRVAVCATVLMGALVVTGEKSEQGALGSIAGIVDVRLPLSRERPRPSVRELGTPSVRGRPDRTQSIVYLEMVPQGAFEVRPAGRAVLDQQQETFIPYALAVTVGTTVLFPNSDPIYHNVFRSRSPSDSTSGATRRAAPRRCVSTVPESCACSVRSTPT